MPGKHVHFDEDVVFFSPRPVTPSPTLSESSLPSSGGPRTPPQQYIPLPIGPVAIHPLLAFHPYIAPILYDVSLPPHSLAANARSSPAALPARILAEPATQPSMNTLTLITDMLPWRLTIRPSSSRYISVLDVFHALYTFLRQPVSAAEYKTLPNQDVRDQVALAFHARCRRSVSQSYEEQKAKGVKRVDFLVGRNRFMGLSSTKIGPDVWVLNVA